MSQNKWAKRNYDDNSTSFTGIALNNIEDSTRAEDFLLIGKDGKSLSFFRLPKLTKVAIVVALVTKSIRIQSHHQFLCKAMLLNAMPSMITKKEACAMEWFRKPFKRLTEDDLLSFEGV